MDPPPPTSIPPSTTTTTTTTAPPTTQPPLYTDSIDSSPRSRATDIDDPFPPTTSKLRLMCSYGGHIVPRPHDKSLCYVGGDTRMVVVDRSSTFSDIISRLSKTLLNSRPFTLKYQLPNEDLDSLITVSTEEDLDNMIDEYDRLLSGSSSGKSSRIRLFLFPSIPEGSVSIGSILDGSNRSEDWFLNALNGAAALQRGFSDPSSVNCLLGLEENGLGFGNSENINNNKNNNNIGNSSSNLISKEMEMMGNGEGVNNVSKMGKLGHLNQSNPDIHSVPDSPIIETTSSFGSTSSSPSLANLPPIRVHVDEGSVGGGGVRVLGGIEEQFAQMGVSVQKQQQQQQQQVVDDQGGFMVISTPPPLSGIAPPAVVTGTPAAGVGGGGEFVNRVYSDDERSDHGVPVGGRKVQQQQQQQQMGQPMVMTSQMPQKLSNGSELLSPDSVSSDSSFSNVISRSKPMVYQDPGSQLSSGSSRPPSNVGDPNTRIQIQQVSETGYVLPPQYDQQQMFQQPQQQQQQHHHQQAQPQQYIPAGAHFVHHAPPGGVPVQAYYPVYPQQSHHHPHQYPVYYVSAGQPQGYNLPNIGEVANSNPSTRPQTPPNPTIITSSSAYNPTRNAAPPKPEMVPPVYRTTTGSGPQFIQVPPSQHQPSQAHPQSKPQAQAQQQQQFMGYSQVHPSQSVAPNSGAGGSYVYEFSDPSHAQIYYTQPLPPSVAPQYQGVTSAPAMVMPDGSSSQIPNENIKQQIRSTQQL